MIANRLLKFAPLFALAAESAGGAGGSEKPATLTIEQQLAAVTGERDTARSDLATRDATILSLTGERDQARNDLATRTTERDNARNDVTARDATILSLTGERDTARNESATRATRITLLESALGVKGVNVNDLPKTTVKKPGESNSKTATRAEIDAMDHSARNEFFRTGGKIVG